MGNTHPGYIKNLIFKQIQPNEKYSQIELRFFRRYLQLAKLGKSPMNFVDVDKYKSVENGYVNC